MPLVSQPHTILFANESQIAVHMVRSVISPASVWIHCHGANHSTKVRTLACPALWITCSKRPFTLTFKLRVIFALAGKFIFPPSSTQFETQTPQASAQTGRGPNRGSTPPPLPSMAKFWKGIWFTQLSSSLLCTRVAPCIRLAILKSPFVFNHGHTPRKNATTVPSTQSSETCAP